MSVDTSKGNTRPAPHPHPQVSIWDRCMPIWQAIASLLVALGIFVAGAVAIANRVEDGTHCEAVSQTQARDVLKRHELIELTNNDGVCAFMSGSSAVFGVETVLDRHGNVYDQSARAINPTPAHVPSAPKAFWGSKGSGIFFWKGGIFVSIIGNQSLTEQDYIALATIVAKKI